MTDVPATLADFQFAQTGLEDFKATDGVMPRIKIVQTEGLWEDNLTNTKFPTLRFIALGLVKQRVLFHHNVENNDVPMCKSSDFETGYPNPDAPRQKSFPWDIAGFNPADFPPDAEGNIKLPCEGCQLKDWGSSPIGDTPYCAEQFTLPIYYDTSSDLSGDFAPAILTLQKSSIKPIRQYLTAFHNANKPPFLNIGSATLKTYQRGQVTYSVPTFIKQEESDRSRWMEFSEQYVDMRKFLQRPPVREDEGDGGQPTAQQHDNTWGQQAPAPVAEDPWGTPPQQPMQQQAPVQGEVIQQAAPVAQPVAPPQAAPVQQQPPAPQPVAPPQPVQVQQPVAAQPPAPQPVQVQQPVQPPVQSVPAEQPPVQVPPPAPVQPETPQQAPVEPVAQQPVQQPVQPTAPAPAAGQELPF